MMDKQFPVSVIATGPSGEQRERRIKSLADLSSALEQLWLAELHATGQLPAIVQGMGYVWAVAPRYIAHIEMDYAAAYLKQTVQVTLRADAEHETSVLMAHVDDVESLGAH